MNSPPSSSRPPLLGLLNPSGRHYSGYTRPTPDSPSTSFRLAAIGANDDDSESDDVPQNLLFERPARARSSAGSSSGPFVDPTSRATGSRGDLSDSDSTESSSSSFSSSTGPPPPPLRLPPSGRTTAGSSSLPLPVTSPRPGQANGRSPLGSPGATGPSSSPQFIASQPSAASASSASSNKRRRYSRSRKGDTGRRGPTKQGLDAYEKALWDWVNVQDLDSFLQDVYAYYKGKGIFCILLSRALNLITVGFVIGFSTFLFRCVDYSLVRAREGETTSLGDVVVERCVQNFSGFTLFAFLAFGSFYVWQIISFALSIRRLLTMYRFYTHLLGVPDEDVQTISWPTIVHLISQIRESNPLTSLSSRPALSLPTNPIKLDAHDIANRILRQENYLVALFNKDVLDLSLPFPLPFLGRTQVLTRVLEWNIRFCLMGFLCHGARGGVRKVFLRERNRGALVEGLRRRLLFMAIVNALFAPFIVLYLLMYSFFRYFEEYHKNPSSIGGRTYTPYAKWKFREFNELPHLFQTRLDSSYPVAKTYIDQFPKERTALFMRFVSFIAGSFAAVLILASVLDPDLVLHFEITPHRTVLFYITLFGTILAVTRGMIPEDNQVFNPELLLRAVVHYTHYLPEEWKGKLHSQQVHDEFGQLFAMKVAVFFREILSVILTPVVLWYSLPRCAPAVIDFFREFTVHVDGVGYVCSFAVFDFKRHGNVKFGAPEKVKKEHLLSKEGKMEKSFLSFKASNPEWQPTDPTSSIFLNRLTDLNASLHHQHSYNGAPILPAHLQHHHISPLGSSSLHLHHTAVDMTRRAPTGTPSASLYIRPPSSYRGGARGGGGGGGNPRLATSPTARVDKIAEEDAEAEREAGWDDVRGPGGENNDDEEAEDAQGRRRRQPKKEEEEVVPDSDILSLLTGIYNQRIGRG